MLLNRYNYDIGRSLKIENIVIKRNITIQIHIKSLSHYILGSCLEISKKNLLLKLNITIKAYTKAMV